MEKKELCDWLKIFLSVNPRSCRAIPRRRISGRTARRITSPPSAKTGSGRNHTMPATVSFSSPTYRPSLPETDSSTWRDLSRNPSLESQGSAEWRTAVASETSDRLSLRILDINVRCFCLWVGEGRYTLARAPDPGFKGDIL